MPFDSKAWRAENRYWLLPEKRAWYKKNRQRILGLKKWLREKDRQLNREACRRYRQRNKDQKKISALAWYRRNKAYGRYMTNLRRARLLNATPKWADMEKIKQIYVKAHLLKKTVDHIVPLKHPLVCGFHIHWNLQILSPTENFRKNNRWP